MASKTLNPFLMWFITFFDPPRLKKKPIQNNHYSMGIINSIPPVIIVNALISQFCSSWFWLSKNLLCQLYSMDLYDIDIREYVQKVCTYVSGLWLLQFAFEFYQSQTSACQACDFFYNTIPSIGDQSGIWQVLNKIPSVGIQ